MIAGSQTILFYFADPFNISGQHSQILPGRSNSENFKFNFPKKKLFGFCFISSSITQCSTLFFPHKSVRIHTISDDPINHPVSSGWRWYPKKKETTLQTCWSDGHPAKNSTARKRKVNIRPTLLSASIPHYLVRNSPSRCTTSSWRALLSQPSLYSKKPPDKTSLPDGSWGRHLDDDDDAQHRLTLRTSAQETGKKETETDPENWEGPASDPNRQKRQRDQDEEEDEEVFLVGKVRKNQKGTKVHRREVDIGQALPYYVQMTCVCVSEVKWMNLVRRFPVWLERRRMTNDEVFGRTDSLLMGRNWSGKSCEKWYYM